MSDILNVGINQPNNITSNIYNIIDQEDLQSDSNAIENQI